MPASEKEQFLSKWEREFHTTLRVLKAFPAGKEDLRPHHKCKTAKELAFVFLAEEHAFIDGVLAGKIDFQNSPPMPPTVAGIVAELLRVHAANVLKLKNMTDAQYNAKLKFFVAPKTPGDVRAGDLLWIFLNDCIHHRGQFSIYLRMADGKVPSIYGPTADEPWM